MADCSFTDLVLDANDVQLVARFWGEVLGAEVALGEEGDARLAPRDGSAPLLWVDPVPEPRRGKTRVHLDLVLPAADVAALVKRGAELLRSPGDDDLWWWILADPEGNEFCAFPPEVPEGGLPPQWPLPAADRPTPFDVVVDCTDPWAQATWWAARTGGRARRDEGQAWTWVEGAAGFPLPYWVFNPVPEAKAVKNRLHWDMRLPRPTAQPLLDAGATLLRAPDDAISWWILADPEGNEFCAFPPED
jgi:hypothetical protein